MRLPGGKLSAKYPPRRVTNLRGTKPSTNGPGKSCAREVVDSSCHGIKEKSKNGDRIRSGSGDSGANDLLERRAFAGILGEQAAKSATLAAEYLKPYYAAALAMMTKVGQETLESR